MARKKRTDGPPPDQHLSGFMVRLPEAYRQQLRLKIQETRRSLTTEVRIALGERNKIVVVQPHAPALVRDVLGDKCLAYRAADRRLPAGIGAQLATQYAHGIPLLLQGPVVPALNRREAKANGFVRDRVLPGTLDKRGNGVGELTLGRGCRQQKATIEKRK